MIIPLQPAGAYRKVPLFPDAFAPSFSHDHPASGRRLSPRSIPKNRSIRRKSYIRTIRYYPRMALHGAPARIHGGGGRWPPGGYTDEGTHGFAPTGGFRFKSALDPRRTDQWHTRPCRGAGTALPPVQTGGPVPPASHIPGSDAGRGWVGPC